MTTHASSLKALKQKHAVEISEYIANEFGPDCAIDVAACLGDIAAKRRRSAEYFASVVEMNHEPDFTGDQSEED